MARLPLAFPPGIFRAGTKNQSKGRWYNAWLVRWYGAAVGPVGGWIQRGTSTVSGLARAALSWRNNAGAAYLAIGTHSKLYAVDVLANVYDITPVGFTAGRADAVASGGYGSGLYGAGTYGTPRAGSTQISDATQWSLDTWGEDLVGVSPDDGKIYEWELATGTPAAQVANSPTCTALVVTAEFFLFALGASDNPRKVKWCDQADNTVWSPSDTNQARDFDIQTSGRLMCGKRVKGGTLILSDTDAHLATFIGGVDIYGFDRIGSGCGAISRQCMASFDQQAAWMSPGGRFWVYNGYAQEIPCEVLDYVQRDFNALQASKVVAVTNSGNSEIEWRYCSAASTEIDRCVVWNFATGKWNIGRAPRTCGVDRGTFTFPILVDASGLIWDHEIGFLYGSEADPYIESGPITLGNGDNGMHVLCLYPDDATVGDVSATFYVRNNPDDVETSYGPYTITSKTDLRFYGRAVRVRFDGVAASAWRVGTPELDLKKGGER